MYQVLQVYASFSFFDNFLSRSMKVGQSSSQLFLNHLVSSRYWRRLGDVAETSRRHLHLRKHI